MPSDGGLDLHGLDLHEHLHEYGRSRELAEVDRRLAALAAGDSRGGALVVAGRPGSGKTTLLAATGQRAQRRGFRLCRSAATATLASPSYAPLVDALEDLLASEPEVIAELHPSTRATLAAVFPELEVAPRGAARPPLPAPHDIGRCLRLALGRLAAEQPVVLVLDDLHAADPETVNTVGGLLRRPTPDAVLLVVSYRPRPWARVSTLVQSANSEPWLTRLELGQLTADDVHRLGCGRVCETHLAIGHEVTGGNPRLLHVLWSTCTGDESCSGEPWWSLSEPTPTSAVLALYAEIAALPPVARTVAQAGAVAGNGFDLELVGEITGACREDSLAGIGDLIDAEVVVADVPGRFRFTHEAMRAAAYWSSPTGWRMNAHAAVASVLRSRGAPVEEYAAHVERVAGDPRTVATELSAAARAVEHSDPERAMGWYQSAVHLIRGYADAEPQRCALLTSLARTQARAGQCSAAQHSLEEREQLMPFREADGSERAEVALVRAELTWLAGRQQEARAGLHQAVRRARSQRDDTLARLRGALAVIAAWDGGTLEEDLRVCDEALLSAMGSASSALVLDALAAAAVVRLGRGDLQAARHCTDEASQLADRLTDDETAQCPGALVWLGTAEMLLERNWQARVHTDRAVRVGRRTGHRSVLVAAQATLALLACRQGGQGPAEQSALEATTIAAATESPYLVAVANTVRALVAIQAQDFGTVFALTGPETLGPLEGGVWGQRAALARGAARLRDDDPLGCLDLVLGAGGGDQLPRLPAYERVDALGLLASAAAAAQRRDEARRHAELAHLLATDSGLTGQLAVARIALAETGERDGGIVQQLGLSARNARRVGHLVVAARGLLLALRCQSHSDDGNGRDVDAHLVAEAQELATQARQVGAPQLAGLVETALAERTAGDGPTADPLDALSPRESEVAGLVARGLTNQQIARRLTLSPKTVETHLSRIFGKLRVSSRAEIATFVGRAAMVPPPRTIAVHLREAQVCERAAPRVTSVRTVRRRP